MKHMRKYVTTTTKRKKIERVAVRDKGHTEIRSTVTKVLVSNSARTVQYYNGVIKSESNINLKTC